MFLQVGKYPLAMPSAHASEGISVHEIMVAHAKVEQMHYRLSSLESQLRRRDNEIAALQQQVALSEAVTLLYRFSDFASNALLDTVSQLSRQRIRLGNEFLVEQCVVFSQSIDALRGELMEAQDVVRTNMDERQRWKDRAENCDEALRRATEDGRLLRSRLAVLERDAAAASLSNHYEDELHARDTLIASLRSQNADLMRVLQHGRGSGGGTPTSSSGAVGVVSSARHIDADTETPYRGPSAMEGTSHSSAAGASYKNISVTAGHFSGDVVTRSHRVPPPSPQMMSGSKRRLT